ncbi:hypothetical protein GmHk_05G012328 [Glycine max]|nr:hypothetical protein GmHk_05G012328 [Glycine max]
MNSPPQNDGVILVCAQLDRNLVDEVSVSLLLSVACGRRFCSLSWISGAVSIWSRLGWRRGGHASLQLEV